MLVALKAHGLPRRLHPLAVLQQAARPQDAGVDDVFHHAEAGGLLKAVAQIILTDVKFRGDPLQRQLFRQMLLEVFQHRADLEGALPVAGERRVLDLAQAVGLPPPGGGGERLQKEL